MLIAIPPVMVSEDERMCVEATIRLNDSADSHAPKLAMWINGTLRRQHGQVIGCPGPSAWLRRLNKESTRRAYGG